MSNRLDKTLNVVFTLAAVAIVLLLAWREFAARPLDVRHAIEAEPPTYLEEWRDLIEDGISLGQVSVPIQIVEFADFECSYCAEWHLGTFKELLKQHGSNIALTIVHVTIPRHRFSRQAAMAVECADAQGSLARFLDVIYSKQDSIGLKVWTEYAAEALVTDSSQFRECLGSAPQTRIDAGNAWATKLKVRATPTFIVNGWRVAGPPNTERFSQLIATLLAGNTPAQE